MGRRWQRKFQVKSRRINLKRKKEEQGKERKKSDGFGGGGPNLSTNKS